MNLINLSTGEPVTVGSKIPGGNVAKHYAEVEEINFNQITIRYAGENKSNIIRREDYGRVGIRLLTEADQNLINKIQRARTMSEICLALFS